MGPIGVAVALAASAPAAAQPAAQPAAAIVPAAVPAAAPPAAGWPAWPTSVSADGTIVVFIQAESPPDTNGAFVVLARDVARATTTPIGFQVAGFSPAPRAVVSADGRYVVASIATTSNPLITQVVAYDLARRSYLLVSAGTDGHAGDGVSSDPAVSADGRYVAFVSVADDLVAGGADGRQHVYVRDLWAGSTGQVDLGPGGEQPDGSGASSPAISADGRHVAFVSDAGNLVPGDTHGISDVFVRDLTAATTRLASGPDRGQGQGDGVADAPAISADGRYVAFASAATNLVPGDTNDAADVFVRDLRLGTTRRVSVDHRGRQGGRFRASRAPAITADGRYLAFESDASSLVRGDTNDATDVFVRDLRFGTTRRVSLAGAGRQAHGDSFGPAVNATGRYVAFGSWAGDLVPGSRTGTVNAFERDLWAHRVHQVNLDVDQPEG